MRTLSRDEVTERTFALKLGRRALGDYSLAEARRCQIEETKDYGQVLRRLARQIDDRYANAPGNAKIRELATLVDVLHALDPTGAAWGLGSN